MAEWIIVEDGNIVDKQNFLPEAWRNISNFNAITDEEYLNSLGWYRTVKNKPQYNEAIQYLEESNVEFIDGVATQNYVIKEKTNEEPEDPQKIIFDREWNNVREKRDQLMSEFEWRYFRYERQTRLNLQVSDQLENLDKYMQDLADITKQGDPFNIIWPEYNKNI